MSLCLCVSVSLCLPLSLPPSLSLSLSLINRHNLVTLYRTCLCVLLQGQKFDVPAGDLGFTLVLWCAGFGAMSIVFVIRRFQGGELGGTLKMQRILLAWSLVSAVCVRLVNGKCCVCALGQR